GTGRSTSSARRSRCAIRRPSPCCWRCHGRWLGRWAPCARPSPCSTPWSPARRGASCGGWAAASCHCRRRLSRYAPSRRSSWIRSFSTSTSRSRSHTWCWAGPVRWLGVTGPVALIGYAVRTIAANVVLYVHRMTAYLFSNQPIGVVVVLAAVVAVAVACARLRWSQTALVLTTLCVTALTLMWPFTQGRLLLPLLPFLGLLAASTVDVAARRAPARFRWSVPLALGVAVLAVTLRQVELREAAARSYRTGVLPPPEDLSPTRILADSVTVVALAPPAPGLEQDIATFQARCPRVLQREPAEAAVFFRVRRDEPCLRDAFLDHDVS